MIKTAVFQALKYFTIDKLKCGQPRDGREGGWESKTAWLSCGQSSLYSGTKKCTFYLHESWMALKNVYHQIHSTLCAIHSTLCIPLTPPSVPSTLCNIHIN